MRNREYLLIFALIVCACCGCALAVPIISGFKDLGVTKADRMELLKDDLKSFNYAVQSGRSNVAAQYVTDEDPEMRQRLLKNIQRSKRKEKIVDSKVDLVTFSEDGSSADVEVIVKFFEIPYYVVHERLEKQRWSFSVIGRWVLEKRESEPLEG